MDFIISTLLSILIGSCIIFGFFAYVKDKQRHERDWNTLSNAVLGILRNKEMHGYELALWIRSNHDLRNLSHGVALYPVLFILEERGYIQTRTEIDKETNRLRRYYSIVKDK